MLVFFFLRVLTPLPVQTLPMVTGVGRFASRDFQRDQHPCNLYDVCLAYQESRVGQRRLMINFILFQWISKIVFVGNIGVIAQRHFEFATSPFSRLDIFR